MLTGITFFLILNNIKRRTRKGYVDGHNLFLMQSATILSA
jgi:hypothetical protein